MARVDNLENFLTDVAGAIREKKGTQDQIPAENFDTEIKSITSGLDTSDATATASDIIALKTAYADGVKIAGNLPDPETLYFDVSQLPNAANAGKGVIQSVFDISTEEVSFNFQNPYIATDKGFTFKTIGGISKLPYSNVSIVIVQLNSQNFYAILFESSSMFITPRGVGWPCWYGGKANLIDSTVKVYHYQNNDWVLDTSKSQTISDNVARKTDYPDWSFEDVFGTRIYFSGKGGHDSFTNSVIGTSYEVFDYYSSESSSFYNKSFDVTDATPPNISNLTLNEVVQRNIYNGLDVYYSDKTSWSKIASSSKNANATTSDILDGKTAYKNNVKITGTMPNNGTLTYTPTEKSQTIPAGYTSGGKVNPMDVTTSTIYKQAIAILKDIKPTASAIYKQIDYIGGTGSQRLYTDIQTDSATDTYEITLRDTDVTNWEYYFLLGAMKLSRYQTRSTEFCFWAGTNRVGESFTLGNINDGNWHTIKITPNALSFDGSQKISYSVGGTSTGAINIFYPGDTTSSFLVKEFKMYRAGELISHLIPYENIQTNIVGMYDLIGNKFYNNTGSGTFTSGNTIGDIDVKDYTLNQRLLDLQDYINQNIVPANIRADKTIFDVTGTAPVTFSTIEEMNEHTNLVEDTFAIVYGTSYIGTYRLNNGAWTQIGNSTEE